VSTTSTPGRKVSSRGGVKDVEAEADSGVPSPELVGMVQRRTTVVAAQRRASMTPEEPKGRRASTSSRSETATDRATPSESGTPAKKRGRPRKQSTSEDHQGTSSSHQPLTPSRRTRAASGQSNASSSNVDILDPLVEEEGPTAHQVEEESSSAASTSKAKLTKGRASIRAQGATRRSELATLREEGDEGTTEESKPKGKKVSQPRAAVKSSKSEPTLTGGRKSAASTSTSAVKVTRSQSALTRRSSRMQADLEPIFGERNKRSDDGGTEEAVESSSLHLLGEFKPKRYSSKAKPKSRKAE